MTALLEGRQERALRMVGHDPHRPQCRLFATLLQHTLENFVQAENGDDSFRDVRHGGRQDIRVGAIRQAL